MTLDPQPTAEDDAPPAGPWDSELVAEKAGTALKELIEALGQGDAKTAAKRVAGLVDITPLQTDPPVAGADGLQVARSRAGAAVRHGREKAISALAGMIVAPGKGPLARVKIKIEQVEGSKPNVRVVALVATARPANQRLSRWRVGLEKASDDGLAVAKVMVLSDHRVRRPTPLFADATAHVLAAIPPAERDVMLADNDRWLQAIAGDYSADPIGHQGLAVGDVNGDGRDDVYVCAPSGVPNRLLVQQPDGTVKDTAMAAGVALLDLSRSALLVDLDNDGDQDLLVSTRAEDTATATAVLVFENKGDGTFKEPDEVLRGGDVHSMAAADYDNDGDLDLHLCMLNADSRKTGGFGLPVPYHDATNGGRNRLLANVGALRFEDVTAKAGLDQNNNRWSYAAAWEDFDNDGDQDLYVANDFGRNNLYRNDKGRFVDVAAQAGVQDLSAGMSVSWGDIDNDGHMDLYVSNMYSAAGRRISPQKSFAPGADEASRAGLGKHARGNTLLRNRGDGTFTDISATSGTTVGRWAWGSLIADLDSDGLRDIAVVNGMFTRPDSGDL